MCLTMRLNINEWKYLYFMNSAGHCKTRDPLIITVTRDRRLRLKPALVTAVSIHFGLMNTILHQSYVIYQNQTCVKLAKWWLLQNNEDRIFLKTCTEAHRNFLSFLFYAPFFYCGYFGGKLPLRGKNPEKTSKIITKSLITL